MLTQLRIKFDILTRNGPVRRLSLFVLGEKQTRRRRNFGDSYMNSDGAATRFASVKTGKKFYRGSMFCFMPKIYNFSFIAAARSEPSENKNPQTIAGCGFRLTLREVYGLQSGAEGRTRTGTGLPTRPSSVRVYQFHHFGTSGYIIAWAPRRFWLCFLLWLPALFPRSLRLALPTFLLPPSAGQPGPAE